MTSGEGGMISCANSSIARNARLLRNQGMEMQYENEVIGYNARMTDIHAAIGREQLKKLSAWTVKRQENAQFFNENIDGVVTPSVRPGYSHVYHQYTIRVPQDRAGFAIALKEEFGVGSGVYYPIPNHELRSLRKYAEGLELPHTSKAAEEVLSIPVHPSLERSDLERIVSAVNALARSGA